MSGTAKTAFGARRIKGVRAEPARDIAAPGGPSAAHIRQQEAPMEADGAGGWA
jgi:hypothetical protein